jgi:hypothetical protein
MRTVRGRGNHTATRSNRRLEHKFQQINFDSLLAYYQTSTNAAFMQCM